MAKRKPITVVVELELTDAEQMRLLENSIERVMNNAIRVGTWAEKPGNTRLKRLQEDGSVLWQDCEELKPLVCKFWSAISEAVRRKLYEAQG